MMNSQQLIDRARLLLEQQRYDQADKLLRQVLAQDPDLATVHSLLAWSLKRDRDKLAEATAAARRGVHLAPDDAFSHFVLAAVMETRNQLPQALESIQQAIALSPLDAAMHGFQAHLYIKLSRWKQALQAAETGLSLDPEDSACASARVFALERLGRVSDAVGEAQRAVRNDPDSSDAHAGHGWAMLQAGKYREAQLSFREALRLEPSNEFARHGMIMSLNHTNFIYRWFDALLTHVGRMSTTVQWALVLGLFFGVRALNSLARANPWLGPYVLPITLAYLVLVLMTWIMHPLFNTFLRFHPFGRFLLSRKETWASNLIAGAIVLGTLVGTTLLILHGGRIEFGLLPFFFALLLTIPLSVAFNTRAHGATLTAIVVAVVFSLIFVGICLSLLIGYLPGALIGIYQLGILIYCFAGQALIAREPRY